MSWKYWLLLLLGLVFAHDAYPGNKIGTGDAGGDLEGGELVVDGPLIKAQKSAVKRCKRLHLEGIPGLGTLIPELENTKVYFSQQDVTVTLDSDRNPFHSSLTGTVYARTDAMPYAPTRFFPVALGLSKDQLIALHVHEALHRSLPESIRTDEKIVSQLTLVITGPEASHDRVKELAASVIPEESPASSGASATAVEHFKQPSLLGYVYRQFSAPKIAATYPVHEMHLLRSDIYPFGGIDVPMGFGIEMSWLRGSGGMSHSGPLGLSGRMRVWSSRDFSIGIWANAALSTLSSSELKNSPFGRDIYSVGANFRKDMDTFFVENTVGYSFAGKSNQTVGRVNYEYGYGSVTSVKVNAGFRVWKATLGGFGELHLADYFRVNGGAFSQDFGRYRILSAGPELTFATQDFSVGMGGRFIVDSTNDASFDFLGNLLGAGVSQGSISANANVFF